MKSQFSSDAKLPLPNVTLIAMTGVLVRETLLAMAYSMGGIDFGAAVLVTDKPVKECPKGVRLQEDFLQPVSPSPSGAGVKTDSKEISYICVKYCDPLDSIDRFNYESVYHLGHYVETDFCLLVHYDGFVVHPENFRQEFLDYDYIGSPWPLPPAGDHTTYRDIHGNLCRVGNSVSFRSKRLLDFPEKAGIPWTPEKGWFNEDGFICCRNRHLFEEAGMRFAPFELALAFGREKPLPENKGIDPFVFHKWEGENAAFPDFRKKPNPALNQLRKLHGYLHNKLHQDK
ncbi:MAG: hypothetical protein IJU50_02350 [Lachnospiraceae bacterium]|nr:hypothetical protein [Lachnospiraceae bacterium]